MTDPIIRQDYFRHLAVWYLKKQVGKPYIWGGNDPLAGFDCSGLIHEVLQAVGLEEHGFDCTAHFLYKRFRQHKVDKGYAGCLVFWFSGAIATHIEMMIDNEFSIGASGGGSATKSLGDAIQQNAFVKMRPVRYRGNSFEIVDPFKEITNFQT